MSTIRELLALPRLSELIERLDAGDGDRAQPVTGLTIVEDVAAIAGARAGAIAILTARASAAATGYQLDIALRIAADRGAAALTLLIPADLPVDRSARQIATTHGVALLRCAPDTDAAELVTAVDRELNAPAAAALRGAHAGVERIGSLRDNRASVEELLAACAAALGTPVDLRAPAADEPSCPVIVDGREEHRLVTTAPADPASALVAEIVLEACAAAVGIALQRVRRAEEAPAQWRADLVTEFLAVEPRQAEHLLDRARHAGVDIDGWHTVMMLEPGESEERDETESERFDQQRDVRRLALEVARDAGGVWHRARGGDAVLLVRIDGSDPGATASQEVAAVGAQVVARCAEIGVLLRAGISTAHPGPDGLRRSVAESRAALASGDTAVVAFDTLGTHRFFAEWSASPSGHELSESLLAPLEALGPGRFEEAVRTLSVYLGHRGSLVHAAAELHLHRNSLAYRIRRITELLAVDLDDPDQRLVLQLAARARALRLARAS